MGMKKAQKKHLADILSELPELKGLDLRARLSLALIALDGIHLLDQVKLLNMTSFCLSIPLQFRPQKT